MTAIEAHSGGVSRPLPVPRTAIVGRSLDLARLGELINQGAPVITVVATGGAGKTRLVTAVAHEHLAAFAGQVFFVSLAGVSEPAGVPAAIAGVLQVRASADRSIEEAVCDDLRHRASLLILDNFEQVLAAAAFVSDLSEQCPLVVVLVTSRSPLRIRGEKVYDLAPLPSGSVDDPGVVLFCDRARAAASSFALTDANTASVLELCARLDGLPLAIELAASWTAMLTPGELLERLDRSRAGTLRLLANGAADAPERHRTLEGAIAWSYELLSPGARTLFRWLTVFESGCTLAAVEAVCSLGDGRADEADLLSDLAALVDLRLLVVEEGAEHRYRMLETIREFAELQFSSSAPAEIAVARARHCAYFQSLAYAAQLGLESRDDGRWLARLEADYFNLRAALGELERRRDIGASLRMAASLGWFWRHSGRGEEGRNRMRAWYESARGLPLDPSTEADVLVMIGRLSAESGLIGVGRSGADESIFFLEQGLAKHRLIGEPHGLMRALESMVTGLVQHEHTARAEGLCQEGLSLATEHRNSWWTSMFLYSVVIIRQMNGELDAAMEAVERARSLAVDHGDTRMAAIGTLLNGTSLMFAGRIDEAERELSNAYRQSLAQGDKRSAAFAAVSLGPVFWIKRDLRSAARWTAAGLALAEAVSEWRCIGFGLTDALYIAWIVRDREAAARFYGAIVGDSDSFYRAMPPTERQGLEKVADRVRQALGAEAFDRHAKIGSQRSRSAAIEAAISFVEVIAAAPVDPVGSADHARTQPTRRVAPVVGGLSPREIEVLALVASGRTNREIAAALSLSVATIERHLVNMYRKIGIQRRSQATSYAIHHRLVGSTDTEAISG